MKWPAPTVCPIVIAGQERSRSAAELAGTAEPIDSTGTVAEPSTLARNPDRPSLAYPKPAR